MSSFFDARTHVAILDDEGTRVTSPPHLILAGDPAFGSLDQNGAPQLHQTSPQTSLSL
ncbi:hypothetical protein IGI04_039911 [Brassica rapa subsp. trilocularis]|uniref:Uncharacterized protein n=1 Tax=Brassica rapa subsp. trilocularis TaxID=1813537 RepID=A0ABQ7KLA3_BRACM|nr:hypothetical protein IGI04_039911 [Brassica rapa subsp. trilocularis]